MAFDEDFSVFFDVDEFGDVLTPGDINGIIDREYVELATGRGSIQGYKPTFLAPTADLLAISLEDHVTINLVSYTVKLKEDPDGTGLTKLILEEA